MTAQMGALQPSPPHIFKIVGSNHHCGTDVVRQALANLRARSESQGMADWRCGITEAAVRAELASLRGVVSGGAEHTGGRVGVRVWNVTDTPLEARHYSGGVAGVSWIKAPACGASSQEVPSRAAMCTPGAHEAWRLHGHEHTLEHVITEDNAQHVFVCPAADAPSTLVRSTTAPTGSAAVESGAVEKLARSQSSRRAAPDQTARLHAMLYSQDAIEMHNQLLGAALPTPCEVCGAPEQWVLRERRHLQAPHSWGRCSCRTEARSDRQINGPGLEWPAPFAELEPDRHGLALCAIVHGAGALLNPAATSAMKCTYRALSENCPDTIILLYEPGQKGSTGEHGFAISCTLSTWSAPLGSPFGQEVHSDDDFVRELIKQLAAPENNAKDDPIVANHIPWIMNLSAEYADAPHNRSKRAQMLTPKLVAIAVEALSAQSLVSLAQAVQNVITLHSQTGAGRCSIVIDIEHAPANPVGLENEVQSVAGDTHSAITGTLPLHHLVAGTAALAVGLHISNALDLETPELVWGHKAGAEQIEHAAFVCTQRPVGPAEGIPGGGDQFKGLYRWTAQPNAAAAGWQYVGPWEEKHGPHCCTELRSGYPARMGCPPSDKHQNITPFAPGWLHAIYSPPPAGMPCRGVVIGITGVGSGAGCIGSFGPSCVFSNLARATEHGGESVCTEGFAILQLIYPEWGLAKLSLIINHVRRGVQLVQSLTPGAPVVLLGWSMGGAGAIEAGARLVTPAWSEPADTRAAVPPLFGVITLASQAAGVYVLGQKGGLNSVQVSLRLLGAAGVPVVVMHGTVDKYVKNFQAQSLYNWARPDKVTMEHLDGDCHPCPSALRRVQEHLRRLLPRVE